MRHTSDPILQLADRIAGNYGTLPQVEAVALAGSRTTSYAEASSDIDLYVYLNKALAVEDRRAIAEHASTRAEVNNQFWEPGDEWIDKETGIHVDVMFRHLDWIEDQLDRVLLRHEASMGYSTCFWHNVQSSSVLFDRNGWFAALQEKANQPYPDTLQQHIINKNLPVLNSTISAYRGQLEKAIARTDWVSVNHRIAALLASYFDIIFAINHVPHPGEKRLLEITASACADLPVDMHKQVNQLIQSACVKDAVLPTLDLLLQGLVDLLHRKGLAVTHK